ncbi:MAG: hypothetical protein HC876_16665 [Chloroflexaceae bacterium]|nr:hypothetical protein [Chloroflexaceae bacterium]NJO07013.1 hypothetical protein [Chloroflexaceae bacterium]
MNTRSPGVLWVVVAVVVVLLLSGARFEASPQTTLQQPYPEPTLPPRPTVESPTDVPTTPPTDVPTGVPTTGPTTVPTAPTAVATVTSRPAAPRRDDDDDSGSRLIDLQLVQTASQTDIAPGDVLVLELIATHAEGNRNAEDVLIFVELPDFLTLQYAETSWGTLTQDGQFVFVTIPFLLPDDEVRMIVVAEANNLPAPDFMHIIGSINSSTRDSDPTNNLSPVPIFSR